MTQNDLIEKVDTIKSVLDRSALYRGSLGGVFLACGFIGLVGAVLGSSLKIHGATEILLYWMSIGVVTVGISLGIMNLQAKKAGERFWRGPVQRLAQVSAPPLVLGALAGVYSLIFFPDSTLVSGQVVIGWMALYGLSLNGGSVVLAHSVRPLGFIFMVAGVLTGFIYEIEMANPQLQHIAMGVTFGGFHLIQGWREWQRHG